MHMFIYIHLHHSIGRSESRHAAIQFNEYSMYEYIQIHTHTFVCFTALAFVSVDTQQFDTHEC